VSSASNFKLHALRAKLRKGVKRAGPEVRGDINVTPLVDVVLVLLIIFMVVTPMIASGVPVDLPQTMHHNRKPDDGKDIIVSVTKTKDVYIKGAKVKPADLPKMILEEKRRFPEKTVFVKGDARTTYGAVREVMESIHKANIDDIMLGTEEIKNKK
jgi:biopolymer transport protein TolR